MYFGLSPVSPGGLSHFHCGCEMRSMQSLSVFSFVTVGYWYYSTYLFLSSVDYSDVCVRASGSLCGPLPLASGYLKLNDMHLIFETG